MLLLVLHVPAPSPTLSPTDPVPRSLLTLWARAGRGALYHASSSVPPRAAPVASLAYTIDDGPCAPRPTDRVPRGLLTLWPAASSGPQGQYAWGTASVGDSVGAGNTAWARGVCDKMKALCCFE